MKNNKASVSIIKSAGLIWSEKANHRLKNRKWLGYSGKIALRILSAMEDTPGMSQKKLSSLVGVSPQHVNKIVKGQENLTLQTIAKFSEVLGIELISFPSFKYNESETVNISVRANITMYMTVYLNSEPNFFIKNQDENLISNTINLPGLTTRTQLISI